MNICRWIKRHRVTHSDKSGFVFGPYVRVSELEELLKTHAIVPRKAAHEMWEAGVKSVAGVVEQVRKEKDPETIGELASAIPDAVYDAMIKASEDEK